MSAEYEVRNDPVAQQALEEAADFIADEAGPERAVAWLAEMREGIQRLEAHPRAYPAVTLRRGQPVHFKLMVSHRVFYFIDEVARVVYVIDVVHTVRETRLRRYR